MKIKGILDTKGRDVMSVRPYENVGALAHRLRAAHVGALVVTNGGNTLLGIVSERDIVACIAERGAEATHMRVSDIMSKNVLTCTEDDNISRIARLMTDARCRHIPVVEGEALVGMVSIGDIVKHRIEEMELEAGVLRDLALAAQVPGGPHDRA